MKFKLVDAYEYWWPVTVQVPAADQAGALVEQTFEVKFRAMGAEQVEQLHGEWTADTSTLRKPFDAWLLDRVVIDWRGLEGDVPFDQRTFGLAMQWPWFRAGVYQAYSASLSGEAARLGN